MIQLLRTRRIRNQFCNKFKTNVKQSVHNHQNCANFHWSKKTPLRACQNCIDASDCIYFCRSEIQCQSTTCIGYSIAYWCQKNKENLRTSVTKRQVLKKDEFYTLRIKQLSREASNTCAQQASIELNSIKGRIYDFRSNVILNDDKTGFPFKLQPDKNENPGPYWSRTQGLAMICSRNVTECSLVVVEWNPKSLHKEWS